MRVTTAGILAADSSELVAGVVVADAVHHLRAWSRRAMAELGATAARARARGQLRRRSERRVGGRRAVSRAIITVKSTRKVASVMNDERKRTQQRVGAARPSAARLRGSLAVARPVGCVEGG